MIIHHLYNRLFIAKSNQNACKILLLLLPTTSTILVVVVIILLLLFDEKTIFYKSYSKVWNDKIFENSGNTEIVITNL